jgi:hypothetical protein
VFVDTIFPVIIGDGSLFLRNATSTVDFTGADGSAVEGGSGINTASILWEQVGGPVGGTITFTPATDLTTSVSADLHGMYDFRLTVADMAGNTTVANFVLNWDIESPNEPVVTGIDHTPQLRPTWAWSSGGNGGTGEFQYRLDGGAWVATTATSFTPGSDLTEGNDSGAFTHVLEVQEKDEVGNWSASGSHGIWVDTTYNAPPEVILTGDTLRTDPLNIIWNWSSGAAQVGATYRWSFDGGATWLPSGAGAVQETVTVADTGTLSGEDELVTLTVEEYLSGGATPRWLGEADGKYGSSSVRIDRQGPVAPDVTNYTASPTKDTTPTWKWVSAAGEDGTGNFRYQLDGTAGSWTTTTSTVYTPTLTHGVHSLYVEEQDALGNWGAWGVAEIDVDTVPPTLNSVTLDIGATYTTDTNIRVQIDAVTEPGMSMYLLDYSPASAWEYVPTYDDDFFTDVPSGEGYKHVYIQLVDSVGNISSYKNDTIILDQTAPANVSVTINSGDTYTPSLDAKLTVSATDSYTALSDMKIRYSNNGSSWTSWLNYANPLAADLNFSIGVGNKYAYVQVKDAAGNISGSVYDSIYLQVPVPTYAWKGYYSTGASRVYYSPVTEPSGASSTYYYVYWSTNSGANPNTTPSSVTLAGSTGTSSTSYDYINGIPKGELVYFWVRAYNPDSGNWGPYSASRVMGFSSNVTVVYDDDDSADIAKAEKIKSILEDESIEALSYVDGNMPTWTVTLLPEDLIPNTYSTANQIYGDPTIITPGSYFTTSSSYDGRVRNIASTGRGVIGMYTSGGYFLYRVQAMWSSWGLSGTSPADIDSGNQMGLTSNLSAVTRPYNISEDIWHYPVNHTYFYDNYRSSYQSTEIFNASVARRGVYRFGGTNPTDGAIYAGDPNYASHFPVVRQGRFLMMAFYDVPDSLRNLSILFNPIRVFPAEAGKIFFINLVARMDNY